MFNPYLILFHVTYNDHLLSTVCLQTDKALRASIDSCPANTTDEYGSEVTSIYESINIHSLYGVLFFKHSINSHSATTSSGTLDVITITKDWFIVPLFVMVSLLWPIESKHLFLEFHVDMRRPLSYFTMTMLLNLARRLILSEKVPCLVVISCHLLCL